MLQLQLLQLQLPQHQPLQLNLTLRKTILPRSMQKTVMVTLLTLTVATTAMMMMMIVMMIVTIVTIAQVTLTIVKVKMPRQKHRLTQRWRRITSSSLRSTPILRLPKT